MGEILTNVNFDPIAFTLNAVGFLILLWLLNKFLFAPAGQMLDQRQRDIASTYDQLEADKRQMETLKADYEQRLANIEAEAREKIQTAIREAQTARDQIVQEANTRAKDIVSRAEEEALREQAQAMITLRQQIVDIALGAANKVIGENLDASRQQKLIDDFINSSTAKGGPQDFAVKTSTSVAEA